MNTFILVIQKREETYEAALYENDLTGAPLAANEFTAETADMVQRFQSAAGATLLSLGESLLAIIAPAMAPYIAAWDNAEPARLLLHITDQELKSLPWELMAHDRAPLFRNASFPVCRIQTAENWDMQHLSEQDWPLRLLIVVASKPDDPAVAAEDEVAQIVDAVIPHEVMIDWKLMIRPSWQDLVNALLRNYRPHIFHFIGHGRFAHGQPSLRFWTTDHKDDDHRDDDDNDEGDYVDINRDLMLAELKNRLGNLRLAFLNACRTSEEWDPSGLRTISDAFLNMGATAVIGTQAEIKGEAAADCAGAFYTALFAGNELAIDTAMARARENMGSVGLRDWAVPRLELRHFPLDLFSSCVKLHEKPDEIKSKFWAVRKLVGRKEIYRQAWQVRLAPEKRPAVIKGDEKVGKTWAAYLLLERCLMANHVVRYVSMKDRGHDYVDLMRATLQGDVISGEAAVNGDRLRLPPPLTDPFPEDKQLEFEQKLKKILGAKQNKRGKENIPGLFEAFRKIVEETFPDLPILLVFDQLEEMEPSMLRDAIIHFGSWHKQGQRLQTLLIIGSVKEDELRGLGIGLNAPDFHVLPVDTFEKKRFDELRLEFLRRLAIARQVRGDWMLDMDKYNSYKSKVTRIGENIPVPDRWKPELLVDLENIISKINVLPGG
ncbi:MAG: CHAT domain-containing protein [Candidatus Promineifilaceae bacterium]|nr:CHAT domain-containing protein [Candidatus Promineifilaceae bacterium]